MLGMYSLTCLLLIDMVNPFSARPRPGPAPPVARRRHAGERGAELWVAIPPGFIMRGLDPRILSL